jgi:hypothetical protein
MKQHLILASVFAVAAAALQGQGNSGPLKATVPFDFVVNQQTLPAGEYRVYESHPGFVIFKASNGKDHAIVMANPLQASNVQTTGRLVFHRYGDVYFLSELWRSDTYTGSQFSTTRRERELASTPEVQKRTTIVAAR